MKKVFFVPSSVLKHAILPLCLLLFAHFQVRAQCGTPISSFPYNESFESGPVWTTGGANSDWAWGTPLHPLISSAPSGTKAWCVGGLVGSTYNGSQSSYLLSPCFDFSSLTYPWISFQVFWETEHKWDGATLQYSTDGGTIWANVGSFNDPVDCLNQNWFNYNSVSWLTLASPKHGWSGRVGPSSGSCDGGNGSGMWVNATHCMSNLAGRPSVRFRFLFGSGNSCNDFDGFAIDDIRIQNAPPNTADFSFACTTNTSVDFTNTSTGCSNSYVWDFGDPASGAANSSSLENPSHTFSAPGSYTVTLTNNGPCNAPGTVSKTVVLISSTITATDVSCFGGNDGTATVNASGSGTISYSWNSNPPQTTATATGLPAGNYTVTVSDALGCPSTNSIEVMEPTVLNMSVTQDASCTAFCNGSLALAASGGTTPYSYSISSFGAVQQVNGTVCPGTYTVEVTDAKACKNTQTVLLHTHPNPDVQCSPANICEGGSAVLTASGADLYSWSPNTNLSADDQAVVTANPDVTTLYTLTGTSSNGCSSSINVLVSVNNLAAPRPLFSYLPKESNVLNPEIHFTNLTEGSNTYTWYFADLDSTKQTDPSYIFPSETGGNYLVCLDATNSLNCTDTYCQVISIDGLSSIFIPNSFSPNGDGLNDLFFPILNDVKTDGFRFSVFNRWGEVLFDSNQAELGWNGKYKGKACPPDTYVWKIQYTEKSSGELKKREGHVSLVN